MAALWCQVRAGRLRCASAPARLRQPSAGAPPPLGRARQPRRRRPTCHPAADSRLGTLRRARGAGRLGPQRPARLGSASAPAGYRAIRRWRRAGTQGRPPGRRGHSMLDGGAAQREVLLLRITRQPIADTTYCVGGDMARRSTYRAPLATPSAGAGLTMQRIVSRAAPGVPSCVGAPLFHGAGVPLRAYLWRRVPARGVTNTLHRSSGGGRQSSRTPIAL